MKIWMPKGESDDFYSSKYLCVNSCGFQMNTGYTIFRTEGRLDYHILYIFSGTCLVLFNEKTYRMSPGHFVFYFPGQIQRYEFADDSPCETLWLHFSGSAVPEILDDLSFGSGVYECDPDEKIISAFQYLVQERQLRQSLFETAENARLLSLLTVIARHVGHHAIATDIEKVILMMHDDYAKPFAPELYAAACSLSVSRFSHKFKQVTGSAPLAFYTRIRCEKAMELLKYTDLNISEIALKVGYDNPLYFSRVFNKFSSLSPSEYRRRQCTEAVKPG